MIISRDRFVNGANQGIMDDVFSIPEQIKSLLIPMTGILIITTQMPNSRHWSADNAPAYAVKL